MDKKEYENILVTWGRSAKVSSRIEHNNLADNLHTMKNLDMFTKYDKSREELEKGKKKRQIIEETKAKVQNIQKDFGKLISGGTGLKALYTNADGVLVNGR